MAEAVTGEERTTLYLTYPDSQAVRLVNTSRPLSELNNSQLAREYAEFAARLGERNLTAPPDSSVSAAIFSHLKKELERRLSLVPAEAVARD